MIIYLPTFFYEGNTCVRVALRVFNFEREVLGKNLSKHKEDKLRELNPHEISHTRLGLYVFSGEKQRAIYNQMC